MQDLTIKNIFNSLITHLLSVSVWLILASWLSAIVGAIIYYVWQHPDTNKSFKGFFKYTFPKYLLVHRSTRLDVIFVIVNRWIEPLVVGPIILTTPIMAVATYDMSAKLFGNEVPGPNRLWLTGIMLLFILLVQDFGFWLAHYLEHKIPVLWEVHKVHHSLPVMTPLSNRRHHPLQLVIEVGVTNGMVGIVLGITSYIANVAILDTMVMGVDVYFIGSVLSFYQLRHSHIPLHYGKFEKWFLSPAQHQLHHSFEVRDWDKNFSLLFSFWDRLAGTINYSVSDYKYRIGLPPQYANDYDSVWKFFIIPMRNISYIMWNYIKTKKIPTIQTIQEIESEVIVGGEIPHNIVPH